MSLRIHIRMYTKDYKRPVTYKESFGCFNFKQIHYYYYHLNYLAALWGMWDLSSLTKDRTCIFCIGSVES